MSALADFLENNALMHETAARAMAIEADRDRPSPAVALVVRGMWLDESAEQAALAGRKWRAAARLRGEVTR